MFIERIQLCLAGDVVLYMRRLCLEFWKCGCASFFAGRAINDYSNLFPISWLNLNMCGLTVTNRF